MAAKSNTSRSGARHARSRTVDSARFGPWALVTGASSGIGAEFAQQPTVIPGRLIRLMVALVPASVARDQTAKMFEAALRSKALRVAKPAEKTS
jgi:hypothetical protein